MSRSQQGARPVWFVLDELDTLKRLPQLHDAITQTRKSGNPVVLGFQGRSQGSTRMDTTVLDSYRKQLSKSLPEIQRLSTRS